MFLWNKGGSQFYYSEDINFYLQSTQMEGVFKFQ